METWCGGEAGVAQLVEQLTCNQQVGGSIPFASSLRRQDTEPRRETSAPARRSASEEGRESQRHLASRPGTAGPARRSASEEGRYPSGQREQTVNLSASAFGGSNPPLPKPFGVGAYCNTPLQVGCAGIAQLVERQPSKLGVAGSSPVSRS